MNVAIQETRSTYKISALSPGTVVSTKWPPVPSSLHLVIGKPGLSGQGSANIANLLDGHTYGLVENIPPLYVVPQNDVKLLLVNP